MLSWGSILYGAGLSVVAAGALLAIVARPRQPAVILMGVLAAAADRWPGTPSCHAPDRPGR
jgi:hypothetical protein